VGLHATEPTRYRVVVLTVSKQSHSLQLPENIRFTSREISSAV